MRGDSFLLAEPSITRHAEASGDQLVPCEDQEIELCQATCFSFRAARLRRRCIRWVLRANYKKAAEDPLLRMNLPRMRTKQRSNVGYTIISDGGNLLQVSTGRKNHIHT
jgi:hypothetical protein